jgi:cobalamin synthase
MESPPVPLAYRMLIGGITGLIGIGLLILVACLLFIASVERSEPPNNPLLITTAVMVVIGMFMSLVSYRLLTGQRSRAGSGLLSPIGWRVIGAIFLGVGVVLAGVAWQSADFQVLLAILWCILFARLCFKAAHGSQRGDLPH